MAEKLETVVNSLMANQEIVVAGAFDRVNLRTGGLPPQSTYWSREVDIFTYPVEPTYTARELNALMDRVARHIGIKPSTQDRFSEGSAELGLGKLYYDEVIGTLSMHSVVELNKGSTLVRDHGLAQRWEVIKDKMDIQQRAWVRIFPNLAHLSEAAMHGRNEYRIPKRELGRARGAQLSGPILRGLPGKVIKG